MADSDLTLSSLTRQVDGEARDDTPAALDAVWEEEQVTFLADKGCDNSVLTQHERRFSQSVAPNYIQVGDAPRCIQSPGGQNRFCRCPGFHTGRAAHLPVHLSGCSRYTRCSGFLSAWRGHR